MIRKLLLAGGIAAVLFGGTLAVSVFTNMGEKLRSLEATAASQKSAKDVPGALDAIQADMKEMRANVAKLGRTSRVTRNLAELMEAVSDLQSQLEENSNTIAVQRYKSQAQADMSMQLVADLAKNMESLQAQTQELSDSVDAFKSAAASAEELLRIRLGATESGETGILDGEQSTRYSNLRSQLTLAEAEFARRLSAATAQEEAINQPAGVQDSGKLKAGLVSVHRRLDQQRQRVARLRVELSRVDRRLSGAAK